MARMQEEDDRRRREDRRQQDMRRQEEEERRRKEDRRREEERREQDRRRRQQEEDERRKRQQEEEARRYAEMKRKRAEDERIAREQDAALAVKKVIQRIRVAQPENFEQLRDDLEKIQMEKRQDLGSQASKVADEAARSLEQAEKRVKEIKEQRIEEERRRKEEDDRRKAEEEKIEGMMKLLHDEVASVEDTVNDATKVAQSATDTKDASPETILESADKAEKAIAEARETMDATWKALSHQKYEIEGMRYASRDVKRDLGELEGRMHTTKRGLDKLSYNVGGAREKAARKKVALQKLEEQKAEFAKFDSDEDGKLSREEIVTCGKTLYDFEVSSEALDKIMKSLEPVTFEKFHLLRCKVAINMTEAKARIMRAEAEEKAKIVEAKKKEVQGVADEAADLLTAAEESIQKAEEAAKQLTKDDSLTADDIKEKVATVTELADEALKQLKDAAEDISKVETDCQEDKELNGYEQSLVPRLHSRHGKLSARHEKVLSLAKEAEEKAVKKANAELAERKALFITKVHEAMSGDGKTAEQYFEGINSGEAIMKDEFVKCAEGLPDMKITAEQAEKLFYSIASDDGCGIDKEKFLELIKLYYKCVKATPMMEEMSIKSKTVKRLEVGEVLECIEGPVKDEAVGVHRVKVKALADGTSGWVTIAGNQGTAFLEPGGNTFKCVKETVITDGLSVQDSKTLRRVTKGEIFEILEFHTKDPSVGVMRVKAKAESDGVEGWITVAGNQGTAFLQPA
eukprot:gnl/TRDRNA2_/TRDRNA2_68650_c0_seq1.p1 gnl/TRDRNA2_/TRDRNA2_68650_c0~~gnl/TRDRNA2_/TRDRNA2_68650_c0_seq1.p1  ORF type:complete len:794 (+),score=281.52 gnl/TRDRNA2_/TRDRNA2_68650_c0_seq1:149-2383(+)